MWPHMSEAQFLSSQLQWSPADWQILFCPHIARWVSGCGHPGKFPHVLPCKDAGWDACDQACECVLYSHRHCAITCNVDMR